MRTHPLNLPLLDNELESGARIVSGVGLYLLAFIPQCLEKIMKLKKKKKEKQEDLDF